MNIYYSDHQPWKLKWILKSLDAVKVEGDITSENKSEHKSVEVNKMLKSQVGPDEMLWKWTQGKYWEVKIKC